MLAVGDAWASSRSVIAARDRRDRVGFGAQASSRLDPGWMTPRTVRIATWATWRGVRVVERITRRPVCAASTARSGKCERPVGRVGNRSKLCRSPARVTVHRGDLGRARACSTTSRPAVRARRSIEACRGAEGLASSRWARRVTLRLTVKVRREQGITAGPAKDIKAEFDPEAWRSERTAGWGAAERWRSGLGLADG